MSKLKNNIAIVFFVLGLLFALSSLANSGALSEGMLERNAKAKITDDSEGLLELKGFNNNLIYDLDKDYEAVGSITNNSNTALDIIINIKPDYSLITNKNLWNGVKIGNETCEFSFTSQVPQEIRLRLDSKQSVNVEVAVSHNQSREIITGFEFTGLGTDGVLKIELGNENARQIIYQ